MITFAIAVLLGALAVIFLLRMLKKALEDIFNDDYL